MTAIVNDFDGIPKVIRAPQSTAIERRLREMAHTMLNRLDRFVKWGCFIAIILLLSGCADKLTFTQAALRHPVGFWYGLWHGMIMPFAWVISLFVKNVAIYAVYNNGGWYDFGFVIGCAIIIGSGSRAT
jgi:hypothetical protein